MSSAANFWRQEFVNDTKHDQSMTDDLRKSELDRYDKAIQAIQANPGIPDDQKNLAITKIRQQGINIMTPSLGKNRVAQLKQQFGIPDVPVNTPTEFQSPAMSAPPISAPVAENPSAPAGSMDQNGNATSVASVMPPAPLQVPDKPASNYAVKPLTTNEALVMAGKPVNKLAELKQQVLEAGGTPDDALRSVLVAAHAEAAPIGKQRWDIVSGKINGQRVTLQHNLLDGSWNDLAGNPINATGFIPDPKASLIPKMGSDADIIASAAQEAGLDPSQLTSQQKIDILAAKKSQTAPERKFTGEHPYTDLRSGNIYGVQTTHTTGSVPAQMPNLRPVSPASAPARTPAVAPIMVNPEPGQTPLSPAMLPTPPTLTAAPQSAPTTPGGLRVSVNAAAAPSARPAAPLPLVARLIGHTASITDKAALKLASKQVDTVTPMVNIDQTMSQYVKGGQYSPRQDLALIVSAVRAMNPGTVRLPQKELDLELHAGSWGDRWKRMIDNASQGLLPNDQRLDLLRVIHNETAHAAKNAAMAWQQQNPTAPVPFQLSPYMNEAADPNEKVPVMVDGKPYMMTRDNIERATADGHKVVRQVGQ